MKQRKRQRRDRAVRLLLALTFAAVVVFMLAGGRAGHTATAETEQETTFTPLETPEPTAEAAPVETAAVVETAVPVVETPAPVVETVDDLAEPEETEPPAPEPDEAEVELLACVIYCEAGGDACSDLARFMVGDVVLNRVDDPRFPDTLLEVLTQKQQYGTFYWTGVVWPERAQYETEAAAVARAYDTARRLLSGEHSEIYGEGYIWQAEFSQGTDVIYLDGIYFGR